jgi:hypothetical protein
MIKCICYKPYVKFKNDVPFLKENEVYFIIETVYDAPNDDSYKYIYDVYDSNKEYKESYNSYIFEHLIILSEYREQKINKILE